MSVNYLIDFLYKLDCLISEINKLNSKVRLYQKNAKKFDIAFDVKFYISPNYFNKLREFLKVKIDNGSAYDRDIVNLKRNFFRNFDFIMNKIDNEIMRIESVQETEMNAVVYRAVYFAKWENEIKLKKQYDVRNSIFDTFLGVAKFRKLKLQNHQIRAELIKKEYNQKKLEKKNISELVSLLENTNIKNGAILCLQEDIVKAFMLDKSIIRKANNDSWRKIQLIPRGILEKRAYFKVLNKNLEEENNKLMEKLNDNRLYNVKENNITKENLLRLNSKITKILLANKFGKLKSNI